MDKIVNINWESEETYWLTASNRSQDEVLTSAQAQAPQLVGHIWLQSSGTSGKQKWVALSKKAILASAASVNEWVKSHDQDVWWLGIPHYHIGGVSILARAHLSGAKVVTATSEKWSVQSFAKDLEKHKISLLSLVPTQVYDLVAQKTKAPATVRGVFVGGGALAQDLYEQAHELGWPLLCTFGMTETCSQIACHPLNKKMKTSEFLILPHAEVKSVQGLMWVRGSSLLTGQLERTQAQSWRWVDPKKDGWLPTEDLIELKDGLLILKGRQTNSVKILGELVQIEEVENNFRNFIVQNNPALLDQSNFIVSPIPDARQENGLALFVEGKEFSWPAWIKSLSEYNKTQQGPWRIDRMAWIKQLPRNAMGKVQRQELKQQFYS